MAECGEANIMDMEGADAGDQAGGLKCHLLRNYSAAHHGHHQAYTDRAQVSALAGHIGTGNDGKMIPAGYRNAPSVDTPEFVPVQGSSGNRKSPR